MDWPPRIGVPLPRAAEAAGVREKLVGYSLDISHEVGGLKARGFVLVLGITIADLNYLEGALLEGILTAPVSEIRNNAPYGINCVVTVPIQGLREKSERVVGVRTVWEIACPWGTAEACECLPRP